MKHCSIAEKYIDDVLNERVMTSRITKLTFERHIRDLSVADEKGWFFDSAAAERSMKFFSLLKHTKGRQFVNKQFNLEPWQCAINYILFGWKKKEKGIRRFSKSYIEIPKKNGKTSYAAGIANYLFGFDDEAEAEVYCAATKRDQAKICFDQAQKYIEQNRDLRSFLKPKFVTNNVSIPSTGSKMSPLGRDSVGLDGINPSAAIIDEYHEWKNDDVLEAIESATVAREQSLIFIITTSGSDKTKPCFNFRNLCLDVLKGIKEQDDLFAIIYTLDEEDDWRDESVWLKANPNYGVSVIPEKMIAERQKAVNAGGAKEASFKTKNLNIWVDAPKTWIKDEIILKCDHGTTDDMLIGQTCYAGLDLAAYVDINALALYFPNINGHHAVRMHYWIPESKVVEHEDRVDYKKWQKEGRIHVTEGNVIDIDTQTEMIFNIVNQYNCLNIAFDPAKAYHGTVQNLQKLGLNKILDEFSQSIRNMSEPTRMLEKLVNAFEIDLMQDPVLRWMFRNAVAYTDSNDNIKLDKNKSTEKIDGVIALINAIGGFNSGEKKPDPYDGEKEMKILNF